MVRKCGPPLMRTQALIAFFPFSPSGPQVQGMATAASPSPLASLAVFTGLFSGSHKSRAPRPRAGPSEPPDQPGLAPSTPVVCSPSSVAAGDDSPE